MFILTNCVNKIRIMLFSRISSQFCEETKTQVLVPTAITPARSVFLLNISLALCTPTKTYIYTKHTLPKPTDSYLSEYVVTLSVKGKFDGDLGVQTLVPRVAFVKDLPVVAGLTGHKTSSFFGPNTNFLTTIKEKKIFVCLQTSTFGFIFLL